MAYTRFKYSCRQKTCLIISVFILILGVLLITLEVLFSVKQQNRKCHKVKHMLIDIYIVVAGIFGIICYCPRKTKGPFKETSIRGSKGLIAVFITFCVLVTVVISLDNNASNYCPFHHEARSSNSTTRLYAILGLVEVSSVHIGLMLCALCIGLASPDLWSRKKRWSSESEKLLGTSEKQKAKQALHLPEARIHIQEAPGTGDKVTVVSLPETNGVVYAVPEQKYVVLRGGNTYMLPPGNTTLTPYFPTIRQTE